jgi:1-acyl-sn-glycerol-3-phosphate acyltransferase
MLIGYTRLMLYQTLDSAQPLSFSNAKASRFPIVRLLRLAAEFFRAGMVLWLKFPRLRRDQRLHEIQRWATRVLLILDIEVQYSGPLNMSSAMLVVANHLSWLDVLVIQSLTPGVFVAKAEVKHWPLIGWMARACGTIFVERASPRSARAMVGDTMNALDQGYSVIAFPEGTSSDGSDVGVFHANIFEGAIKARTDVQPLSLRYVHAATGLPQEAALFLGDMTLVTSLRRVMASSAITTQVHFGACIGSQGQTRKSLASQAQQSIRRQLTDRRHGLG